MIDIWGRMFQDHWRGDLHAHSFVRDDGRTHVIPSAAEYFVVPRSPAEQQMLVSLTGRVLDLGCGPGSYTRLVEDRSVAVTAVDASPGAIAVARERGCRDARVADMDDLPDDVGPFDAIICMGNTLGIGEAPDTFPRRLALLRALVTPNGRLIAAMRDPLSTTDPEHLAYHARNRAAGRPVGMVRARIEYRGEIGEWWDLWMPTEAELRRAAAEAGWTMFALHAEGTNRLYEFTHA